MKIIRIEAIVIFILALFKDRKKLGTYFADIKLNYYYVNYYKKVHKLEFNAINLISYQKLSDSN